MTRGREGTPLVTAEPPELHMPDSECNMLNDSAEECRDLLIGR